MTTSFSSSNRMRPSPEIGAIPVFAEVGLAAERLRTGLDRFVKGEVLEGVKRVVMDEYGDRPLGEARGGTRDRSPDSRRCKMTIEIPFPPNRGASWESRIVHDACRLWGYRGSRWRGRDLVGGAVRRPVGEKWGR